MQLQEQVTAAKLTTKKNTGPHVPKKITSPQILDQSEGEEVCGPDQFDQPTTERKVELIESKSSQNASTQVKFEVMQRAVATCPKDNMGYGRKRIPSLLPSGSQVHQLFQLTAANNGKLPVSMYVEIDLDFLGVIVPKVWVLIIQEPNKLLDDHHKTKLPGIICWNLSISCLSTHLDKRA